jgi:hypothetical protein
MAKRKVKRKRDAKGHFIKAKSRMKRKRPAAARKRTRTTKRRARRAAPRSRKRTRTVRVKGALGRKNGRFVRRRRHAVKGHTRKAGRGRPRRRIKRHLSYEAAAKAKTNPRRRRKRRAAREEEEMPRRRRRRAKAATPRRRRRAVRENPVRRRRRRRHAAETPVRRRRRRNAVANPRRRRRHRKVLASTFCRRRAKSKRPRTRYVTVSSTRRRRKHSRRKSSSRRTPRSHRLPAHVPSGGPEYIGAEFMENPLSGGELALAVGTAAAGYILTDILDRYLANSELATAGSSSLASGATPLSATMAGLTKPGIWRILAQAGAGAIPLAAAYYVKEPMGRAALQGFGLGALVHLLGQVVEHYVIAKYLGSSTPTAGTLTATLNNLYGAEIIADNASDLATTGTAGTLVTASGSTTIMGLPRGVGRSVPRAHQVPRALAAPATGVGACGSNNNSMGNCNTNPMGAAAAAAAAWANSGAEDETCPGSNATPPIAIPPGAGGMNGGGASGSGAGAGGGSPGPVPVVWNGPGGGGSAGSSNGASGGGSGAAGGGGTVGPIMVPPNGGAPVMGGGNGVVLPPMNGGGSGVYVPPTGPSNPTPLAGVPSNGMIAGLGRVKSVYDLFPSD